MMLINISDEVYETWAKSKDWFMNIDSIPWEWAEYHIDFDNGIKLLLKRF